MLTGLPCTSVNSLSFPAGQISLRLGILFLSLLTFLKNLFCILNYFLEYCTLKQGWMWLTSVHNTASTNELLKHSHTHNKQTMQIPLSLTTFTNLFFFRVCSSEAASGRVAGGAEEAAGGCAKLTIMSWCSKRTDSAVGEPGPDPETTAESKPRSPVCHTGCVYPQFKGEVCHCQCFH